MKQKVLFRLLTLQIAPIHLLHLNSILWAYSMTCWAKGKTTPISLSGRCPHYIVQCSMDGEVKATYRCNLRRARMLHTGTVMLITEVKLQYQGLGESAKLLQREQQAQQLLRYQGCNKKSNTKWVSLLITCCSMCVVTVARRKNNGHVEQVQSYDGVEQGHKWDFWGSPCWKNSAAAGG